MKYQITMNSIAGEYEAESESRALDLFAKDAGYKSWDDACSQGLASSESVSYGERVRLAQSVIDSNT